MRTAVARLPARPWPGSREPQAQLPARVGPAAGCPCPRATQSRGRTGHPARRWACRFRVDARCADDVAAVTRTSGPRPNRPALMPRCRPGERRAGARSARTRTGGALCGASARARVRGLPALGATGIAVNVHHDQRQPFGDNRVADSGHSPFTRSLRRSSTLGRGSYATGASESAISRGIWPGSLARTSAQHGFVSRPRPSSPSSVSWSISIATN